MGVLIFAFRKLFLKRQINDKNYRLMSLSQKQQTITSQIGMAQQSIAAAKNMTNIFSQNSLMKGRNEIYAQYTNPDGTLNVAVEDQNKIAQELQAKQYAAMMSSQMMNSIFDNMSTSQMAPLNAMDSEISMEMASLESQLKQLTAEYEGVEKAETDAAKQSAPKFGLG